MRFEDAATLNNVLSRNDSSGTTLRQGTITAVTEPTVTVDLGLGEIPNVAKLRDYTAYVGDIVQVLQSGPDYLVIGSIGVLPGIIVWEGTPVVWEGVTANWGS